MKKVQLSKPQIDDSDITTVTSVLKSGRLSIGPYTEAFESTISEFTGVKYAVAVSSGTSALHLIIKALGFSEKSLLIVPSFTFIASSNIALYEKGEVLFVDIEPSTMNIDPKALEELLEKYSKTFFDIYLMGVDIFGHPLNWDETLNVCSKYNVKVVEDSCEALGSEYKGKKLGSFGLAGAFAFYANKQITTGEGGVIVTNNENLYNLTKSLRNQGRAVGSGWLEHQYIGYNYRIDEMSAALGWSQMKRIDKIIEKRSSVASRYNQLLIDSGIEIPIIKDYATAISWFVYVVRLPKNTSRIVRDKVINYLVQNGVESKNYFEPIHLQRPYRELGWKEGMLPITEEISQRTIALPFYTDLTLEDQEYVVDTLKKALELYL